MRFISLLVGVRIEWCKARARALRWAEEVELLQEEMRRVLQFLDWQANWWEEQGRLQICQAAAHNEGLLAYAARQANIRRRLSRHFRTLWAPSTGSPDSLSLASSLHPSVEILPLPDIITHHMHSE
jgi:hypothetical protein